MVDRCKDPDFVDGILFLLGGKIFHFYLFEGIELCVSFSPDFIN